MPEQPLIAGRYEILNEIGRGGMGLVARAYDHRLDTEVALKVLRRDLSKDSGDRDSLLKEGRVLARLTHPSIVRLFDLAETEIGMMLVLEYVRGPNLMQVMERRGTLTQDEFLHVARQVCEGLAAAHAEGVIHRDLKPPNLLVAPSLPDAEGPEFLLHSRIKITDFGISKLLANKVQATATDAAATSAAGTPVFMAPEQFAGRPCTPATDVYALGVIAYMAFAGRPPFMGENVRELAFQHFEATAEVIASISPPLNAVIQKALAKAPTARYQTALDFLRALEDASAPPIVAEFLPPPALLEPDALDRGAAWLARNWWKLALLFVAVVAALAYLLVPFPSRRVSDTGEPRQPPVAIALGKIVDLPRDMDVAPAAAGLPPATEARELAAHPGPRKAPHVLWAALIDSDDFHIDPEVDGIGPDGTVYVRDKRSETLWAVRDGALLWGFRAPEDKQMARFGQHVPRWPADSHVDFRDPGRVWLANCEPPGSGCQGAVFNAEGKGGLLNQVPATVRVRRPGRNMSAGSTAFRQDDPQHGSWPERADAVLRYTSRQGTVTLAGTNQNWTVALDGQPTMAARVGDGFLVATVRHTVYAIRSAGGTAWTYASPTPVQTFKELASGDVVLLTGEAQDAVEGLRQGKAVWHFKAAGRIPGFGPDDSTGAMFFLTQGGPAFGVTGIDAAGKSMWSIEFGNRGSSAERLLLDASGRLYISDARVSVDGKARKGVVCLSE